MFLRTALFALIYSRFSKSTGCPQTWTIRTTGCFICAQHFNPMWQTRSRRHRKIYLLKALYMCDTVRYNNVVIGRYVYHNIVTDISACGNKTKQETTNNCAKRFNKTNYFQYCYFNQVGVDFPMIFNFFLWMVFFFYFYLLFTLHFVNFFFFCQYFIII